jgi:hypothetical protein
MKGKDLLQRFIVDRLAMELIARTFLADAILFVSAYPPGLKITLKTLVLESFYSIIRGEELILLQLNNPLFN